MSRTRIVGCDPGGTTGLAVFDLWRPHNGKNHHVWVNFHQYESDGLVLSQVGNYADIGDPVWIVAEAFVVNKRAGRSSSAGAGKKARDIIGALSAMDDGLLRHYREQPAGLVKPWANDIRLAASGFGAVAHNRRHEADAARHALWFAVSRLSWPDPLIRSQG